MRGPSIRGVLFVLALAFQALAAGGFGLDEHLSGFGRPVDQAYCRPSAGSSDRQLPGGNAGHAQDCLACQICLDGLSPLLTQSAGVRLAALRAASSVQFAPARRVDARPWIALSHRARAPPVFV